LHDFGATISDGSPLAFTFLTRNPLDRPLVIRGGTALSPCCSSIGPLPKLVPSGDQLAIPITIRTKGRSGRQHALFDVTTDDPKRPRIRLEVMANLVEECEIVEPGSVSNQVVVGRPATHRLRLILRRKSGSPATDYTVVAPAPLAVSLDGAPQARPGPTGTIETWQDLLVELPVSTSPGRRVAELRLRRHDGSELTQPFSWEVVPAVQATPKGLVLKAEDGAIRKTILVRSTDGPIRITGVEGATVNGAIPLPEGPAGSHRIDVILDPLLASHTASSIEISTDHPGQSKVSVSVVVLR
jgi:hypothetical protein